MVSRHARVRAAVSLLSSGDFASSGLIGLCLDDFAKVRDVLSFHRGDRDKETVRVLNVTNKVAIDWSEF